MRSSRRTECLHMSKRIDRGHVHVYLCKPCYTNRNMVCPLWRFPFLMRRVGRLFGWTNPFPISISSEAFMESHIAKPRCLLLFIWLVLSIVGGCAFLRFIPPLLNDGSVTGNLRGSHIINIRTADLAEEIAIFDRGSAVRYFIKSSPESPETYIQLPDTMFQDVITLRSQWCQDSPRLRLLTGNEPFYDIGLLCGTFTKKRIKVPVHMLPPPLGDLINQVPSPKR
jgi:hypothetical protein